MLSDRDAFKVAFLKRCAEEGLSAAETVARVKQARQHVKTASGGFFGNLAGEGVEAVGRGIASVLGTGSSAGLWALGLAPFAVGGGLGYGAAKLTDIDDDDVKAVQTRELIEEYRRNAAMLQQKRQAKLGLPAR